MASLVVSLAAFMSMFRHRRSGSASNPSLSSESVKNCSPYSAIPAFTKTQSMRPNLAYPAAKPARWEGQEVMLQVWTRILEGECLKVGGGGWRSKRMRLWDGLRVERRVAVERPMPDEPPVMSMVLGVEERVWRDSMVGVKSDIVVGDR
jgi:hypothetical protein